MTLSILKVPYLGTAEDDVLLAEWFVSPGERLRKGQAVAAVETLKASFEVEAEHDGVMARHVVEPGTRVPLLAPLAIVSDDPIEVDDAAVSSMVEEARAMLAEGERPSDAAGVARESTVDAGSESGSPVPVGGAGAPVAPAARRVAKERGIDLERVRGTGPGGMVKVEDVEAVATQNGSSPVANDGRLAPAFVEHVRRDRAAFAALASEFKVALYRQHGAVLGDGTVIAPGASLCVEQLRLGDGAYFGPGTNVDAGSLTAGDLLHFGRDCRVRCTRIQCGDNAFFTDDIEIGGGGAMEPEAELVVGSHGFVGEHVHLNPCRRLEIGDEVVISRNAVVMTHSFGGSILKGFPNRFAGVRIGSYSQIGIQATLFPGVELGEGSILLSGSSLVSAMPAGRLFGGVPATDMKAAAAPMPEDAFARVATQLTEEFVRQMRLRGRAVDVAEDEAETTLLMVDAGNQHLLRFGTAPFADRARVVAEEVRVALRVTDVDWDASPDDVVLIDLSVPRVRGPAGPLCSAFREFLRKRGVRMRPRSWTYRGGWL